MDDKNIYNLYPFDWTSEDEGNDTDEYDPEDDPHYMPHLDWYPPDPHWSDADRFEDEADDENEEEPQTAAPAG